MAARATDPGSRTRRVVLGGITLGTALVVLVMWNGGRLHLGSLPDPVALIIGTVVLWFLLMVAGVVIAALVAAFGGALMQAAGEALEFLARAAGRATTALFGHAHKWAEPRWKDRKVRAEDSNYLQPGEPRCPSCKGKGRNEKGDDACPLCRGWGDAPDPDAPPQPAGTICRACGRPGTSEDPVVGDRCIHRSHETKRQSLYRDRLASQNGHGDTRLQVAEAGTMTLDGHDNDVTLHNWRFIDPLNPTEPARPATEEDMARLIREYTVAELHEMSHGKGCTCPISRLTGHAATSSITPQPQREGTQNTMASPTTQAPRAGAPAGWKGLVASTADFEPESDSELLDWMAGEVAGMSSQGEAYISVYEHCVDSRGLDPASMAAMHDCADAVAEAATAMAYARQKFASVYEQVREAVSNGLVLPHDGRWITGEGEA